MSLPLNATDTTQVVRQTNQAHVVGIATSSPSFSISQDDACLVAQQLGLSERWNHALPTLYRKTGVSRRGSVLLNSELGEPSSRQSFYRSHGDPSQRSPSTMERMNAYAMHAGDLLFEACHDAVETSGIDPFDITHLVTVSCTGFYSPGIDFEMIRRCGLSPNVQRTHIGFMGCHAVLNGLNVARSIVESDPNAVVMLGAVELCSLHQQYTDDPQQLVANALFADGAAAVILASPESLDTHAIDQSESRKLQSDWVVRSHCSHCVSNSSSMMSWTIGNHGFRMSLDPQVPALIEGCLAGVIQSWLDLEGLAVEDIDGWAIHPGGPRIVQSAGRSLALDTSQLAESLDILSNHGNMSSPTVLFILEQLLERTKDSRYIVLLAFGPGLCIEACLLARS